MCDEFLVAASQTAAQDVEQADGGAAKREGVLGTGRGLADRKHTRNGIELVGHGNDAPGNALRKLVAGEARAVVVANRSGDGVGLASGLCIITAHDALLARELDHGAGDEVRLAEVRGTNRVGGHHGVAAGGAGNFAGKGLDALALLQHGAKLLLENDARQALTELLERDLEVLVVEELRIV